MVFINNERLGEYDDESLCDGWLISHESVFSLLGRKQAFSYHSANAAAS